MSKKAPSLEEYTRFHGMLCSPRTAGHCVNSVDGSVLVMPSTYAGSSLQRYDRSRPILSVLTYYWLVLVTFTGLSTLLKLTKFQCVQRENDQPIAGPIASTSNEILIADESVWNYLLKQNQTKDLTLTRRFEYSFCGGWLSMVVLHISCGRNLLHLVEVYRIEPRPLRAFFSVVLSISGFIGQNLFAKTPSSKKD